jgi:2-hydroxy-3-oxopropionate reductase
MIERRFEPGARIELHQKDLELALAGARELGLALPGTANAQQLFNACARSAARAGTTRRW